MFIESQFVWSTHIILNDPNILKKKILLFLGLIFSLFLFHQLSDLREAQFRIRFMEIAGLERSCPKLLRLVFYFTIWIMLILHISLSCVF